MQITKTLAAGMPVVVFYISGHGFGHASRQIEIIRKLQRLRNDLHIIIKTPTPRWFFDIARLANYSFKTVETDTGVVQPNSLQVDVVQSIRKCDSFHRTLEQRAASEAAELKGLNVRLIVGDIPPLAFRVGTKASIPTVAISNFTWDWIYSNYADTTACAPELVNTLSNAYSSATMAWRFPLHAGFHSCRHVVDVPLVARRSTKDPRKLREYFKLPHDSQIALFSFGRYGVPNIDWNCVREISNYHFVFTSGDRLDLLPNAQTFTTLDEAALSINDLDYADVMAAVDVVITKPGFGMIAECAANDTAMLYTDRHDFPEDAILIAGMPTMIRAARISNADLLTGNWRSHLDSLLTAKRPESPCQVNGAEVIGERLAKLIG
tara:strand:- start:4939 stop:6075 length:1137 start_codon:yes stop_codon:yes gene_type:complete